MVDFIYNRLVGFNIGNKSLVFLVGGKRQKEFGNLSKFEFIGGQLMFILNNNISDYVFDFYVNF